MRHTDVSLGEDNQLDMVEKLDSLKVSPDENADRQVVEERGELHWKQNLSGSVQGNTPPEIPSLQMPTSVPSQDHLRATGLADLSCLV